MSLRLDAVQQHLASIITQELEATLETPISIGSLRVIHLNEIALKEITICDFSKDTIFFAEKATAHISIHELLKRRIQINTLSITSPDIRINRATRQSSLNIQFLIDKLKNEDDKEKERLALRINQILIYDGKFRYDVNNSPDINNKFDPSHIAFKDIDCNISMRKFMSDEIDLLIRSIKGNEKSGFKIDKLKTSINVTDNKIKLDNTNIIFPNSIVFSDSITILFEKENPKALEIIGNINSERITITDFTPFINELPHKIPVLSFDISNRIDSTELYTTIEVGSIDNNISLNTVINTEKPYDKERKTNIFLKDLILTKDGISMLQSFVSNGEFNIADKVGDCSLSGEAEITSQEITGEFYAETANGNINANITYNDKGLFDISAEGNNINIGNLTNIKEPLTCSLHTKSSGCFNKDEKNIRLTGNIVNLKSSKYEFSPIEFFGSYDMTVKNLTAKIKMLDPGLTAQMNFNYTNKNEHKAIVSLDIDSINPFKVGLSNNIKETFSFNFDSELTYSNEEKSLLNAKLQNFTYRNDEEKRTIRNLHFCDKRNDGERLTMINSDFINFSIIGQYDYESILTSLYKQTTKHTPSLFTEHDTANTEDCNYIFKCDIKDSHFISHLLKLPFTINKPSLIEGSCNDNNGVLSLNTILNDVEINNSQYKNVEFRGNSTPQALVVESHIIKPIKSKDKDGEQSTNDLKIGLNCQLFNDTIQNTFYWGNKTDKRRVEGNVCMETILDIDKDDKLFIKSEISPDSIVQNDSVWYISGSTVSGHLDSININGLYLYNDYQYLRLDGTVGKKEEDILKISAKNLEVSTILDLVKFRVLKFNGNATGTANASSILSKPEINGNFKVDSFKIDNGYLGNLDLNIGWRNNDKSIFLNGDIHNDAGRTSRVNGFFSQANDTIHLDIDANELNAAFINKMVRSFMSDIQGTGSGKVSLLGKWRGLDMTGAIALNCSARINPTKVRYTFHGDSLYFTSGKLSFKEAYVTDKRGNGGWLSGEVTHKNLANWSCDLNARVNNLLVYDTYNFDEIPVYGTVYATGNANLKANSNGLFLKAEVRNEPNSRIVYNSSESGGVRDNSFVTFIDSSKNISNNKEQEEQSTTYKNVESKLNLDFFIEANEGLQIKVYTNLKSDDYIDLYGQGAINAIYDEKDGFSLKGNLDLDRGTYKITVQDIFTKEFNITKGSSLLFNGNPYDANLDIKTKYLVPSASLSALTTETNNRKSVKVNCLMDITGTLASPILNFDLELPEGSEEEKEMLASATSTTEQKNMQFIYLLGIGKFYTYDYSNSLETNTQNNTTAVESLISNTLSGQLNNMLGQIIDNGNWNISGNISTSERGWNNMEVEGMLEGRLLNDRLLINGNLGYRENPVANRNVIGDFELQLLLNRTGTISLRAYSKTNDRYFSKTNLTTQGAGIILRHDFNSWRWWKKKKEEE